jgi:hypothetical protein
MDETIKEIEIALRDGMIEELTATTEKSIDVIHKLIDVIKRQELAIKGWESMGIQLKDVAVELNELRETAIETSVRLLDECMSCSNEDHHGSTY